MQSQMVNANSYLVLFFAINTGNSGYNGETDLAILFIYVTL